MLEAAQEFDRNIERYYQNLGVNVIFTKSWFKDQGSISENLEHALSLILKNADDPIDVIYEAFKPFADFKYVYTKYIAQVLGKYNISVGFSAIYVEDYLEEEQKQQAQVLLKRIFSKKFGSSKISFIQGIIKKSGIESYQIGDKTWSIDKQIVKEPWMQAVLDFDFNELKNLKNMYEVTVGNDDPEQQMKLAVVDYYLEDYVGSYSCLRRSSWQFYLQNKFPQYFISQVNLKYDSQLARILSVNDEKLTKEFDKKNEIDLDQTFESLPIVERRRMEFLRELSSFSISYSLFQKLYVLSNKTLNEANSQFALKIGNSAYDVLRKDIKDFFDYELYNGILLDHYRENTEIFHMYIKTILVATATPTRFVKDLFSEIQSHNITPDSLEWFDIFVLLRFTSDSKELKKYLEEIESASISIDDEAKSYLRKIIPNLSTDNSSKNRLYINNLFWWLIYLCRYIRIDSDIFESLLREIDKVVDFTTFDSHGNEIFNFLGTAEQEHLLSTNAKVMIKKILKKDLAQIASRKDPSSHSNLTQQLASCCDKVDNSFVSEINSLIDNHKLDVLVDIYRYCSKKIQRKIREAPGIGDLAPNPEGYIRYLQSVQDNIIDMKKADNDQIIDCLKGKQEDKSHVKDDEDEVVLAYCNLILVNPQAARDKEKIKKVIKESRSEICKWLIDVDGFNYKAFDLNWLLGCPGGLLKKLAKKPIVRKNVIQEVKKQFSNRTLDNQILKIYMEYFA